jgi:type IV pilus assembly protein PilB
MKKRIGDILLELGFIDDTKLKMALEETKKSGLLLGNVLLRLDWVTEEQLQMAIAIQSGAKILDTKSITIDQSLIAQIPLNYASSNCLFPVERKNDAIIVAMANPFDVVARDELSRMTGARIETYVAPRDWITDAIERYYKIALSIDESIERITRTELGKESIDTNHIIKLGDLLIEKGAVLEASDIHIVADTNLTRIYYRVDGVLQQNYLFHKSFHKSLVQRFKIMGDIDISNSNIPLDGRIQFSGQVGDIDIRVSTFPTQFGETVVMRLLKYSKVVGNLDRLGFEEKDLERFNKAIRRPYGLILVTGPTGSGKTSTLYSALMSILTPDINVMTIEDPIEYVIPTIRQTAVNPKAGLTFATALRSAMRQDPDVILVGEIRDQETTELALRASITGHFVLSTLHTNDAASAITRLMDLGAKPNILASAITMVVAQRLLRKICPKCMEITPIEPKETELFHRHGMEPPQQLARHKGCENCHNTGYTGRIGIFETIAIDRGIEELISSGAPLRAIEEKAMNTGTVLMFKQALTKVASLGTTLEEVLRVIADA